MRSIFSILFVLLFFSVSDSFAQFGTSRAILTGVGSGRNVTITPSPCGDTSSGFAGVINCNLDGVTNTPFYCLDLCTGISVGDTAKDSASTIPQAIYITNTYFPARTTYPGKLSNNNDEACAVQLAIWHFRNGLVISNVVSISANATAIRNRANAIIADVNLNGLTSTQISTLEIKPGVDPDDFYIETKDTAGNPVAINNIQLSIIGSGTLSTNTVNTNASGISPDVTVTGALNSDVIRASATVQVPGGITYASLRPTVEATQLLVLGRTTTANRNAEITWGALPVELTSFTALVYNTNVDLSWKTSEELNNRGFEVERKEAGSGTWRNIGFVEGHGTTTTSYIYTFTDRNLSSGTYNYRLKQIDFNGNYEYYDLSNEVIIGTPAEFSLSQNFPNPFNPETKISFQIPTGGNVSLKVFDNSGKEVATLVNGSLPAGYHTANFNAASLSSGVYFYKLESQGFVKVMKMALVK